MSITLQDLRDHARTVLDVDDQELPNSLLDVWAREGSRRVERYSNHWPFYEYAWNLTTTSGVSDYTFTEIQGNDTYGVRNIHAIHYDENPLTHMGVDTAERFFQVDSTGAPTHWREWGRSVRLYPQPDSATALYVRGQRQPHDWVTDGAGAEPDMDESLQELLYNWVLGKTYAWQEDRDLSIYYQDTFQDELERQAKRILSASPAEPFVLGGGGGTTGTTLSAPRYPWES